MKPSSRFTVWVLTMAAILLLPPSDAPDSWYSDVTAHWAENYIRTLWEEEITDGEMVLGYPWWGFPWWGYRFYPDRHITRAQYAVMLAKCFRLGPYRPPAPTFPDVPENYAFYGKRVFEYLEAACNAGIIGPGPQGKFFPESTTSREEAVTLLVAALGLSAYAGNLTADEVKLLLGRFRDAAWVSAPFRKPVAAAAKLKIIEGYPDGSLRPWQPLTRAEAATLLYRSCLMLVRASPETISPDGDGVGDTTTFSVLTLKNRGVAAWNLFVGDYGQRPIRTFNSTGRRGEPPATLSWDGTGDDGKVLPEGTYYYWGWVVDRQGQTYRSPMKPVFLEMRSLVAWLSPELVSPGGTVSVNALTSGRALGVEVQPEGSGPFPLEPQASPTQLRNNWCGSLKVDPLAQEGTYTLTVRANYSDTDRSCVLRYRVAGPLAIWGQVIPNPVLAGADAQLAVETSFEAERVEALFHGEASPALLSAEGAGQWSHRFRVPPWAEEGQYHVQVTGYKGNESASARVTYEVTLSPLDSLRFILTD